MLEALKYMKLLQGILGAGSSLEDAVTWLEVEENAERLRQQGHEGENAP